MAGTCRPPLAGPAFRDARARRLMLSSRHEDRDLEHQRRSRPHRQSDPLAERKRSRHRLPAGDQERGRSVPAPEIEALGYNVETNGQKGFNGVALLSKLPFDEVTRGLPGDDADDHARFIEGVFSTPKGRVRASCRSTCRTAIPSAPTNSPTSWPGWAGWSAGRGAAQLEEALVLAGDYNVIPEPRSPLPRALAQRRAVPAGDADRPTAPVEALGLTEAIRATTDDPGVYTFWDYQAGAWQKNNGIRIDHLLLSPEAANRLRAASAGQTCACLGKTVRPRAGGDRVERRGLAAAVRWVVTD